jgi:flagellar basal-body rod protein FlgB
MSLSLDKYFVVYEQSMRIRQDRAEILANNLANANTPGFKARDVDFKAALADAESQLAGKMRQTSTNHMPGGESMGGQRVQFRTPSQPDTGDGNTVDTEVEKMAYMENAYRYNASVQFLTGRITGMLSAIKGE